MMYFGLYKNLNFALLAYQFVDDTVFVGYFQFLIFFNCFKICSIFLFVFIFMFKISASLVTY